MELPKSAPIDVIEDLRRLAESSMLDMFPHAETISDTIEGEAADLIEEMLAAFQSIRDGDGDPIAIASKFLEDPIDDMIRTAEESAPGSNDN